MNRLWQCSMIALARRPHNGRKTLMLDMEDIDYVGLTLDLRKSLEDRGAPTAVTVQAYLHRSEEDIRALCDAGAFVRLVKGAFVGESRYAFSGRPEIDANYRKLAALLLSPAARKASVYPAFATHDHKLIGEIRRVARDTGWMPGSYEFEMLYGVRPELQKELVAAGESVRLYLPYGRDWWPQHPLFTGGWY